MPARPSTTERGYGWRDHQAVRKRLKPTVDAGLAWCAQPVCVMPTRHIQPGTPWALGHNDQRTAHIGPVHHKCNQLDGARKGGRAVAARRHNQPTDPRWAITTH